MSLRHIVAWVLYVAAGVLTFLIVGAILTDSLSFGPTFLASLAGGVAVTLLLKRHFHTTPMVKGTNQAQADTTLDVVGDGQAALSRLRAVAPKIKDAAMRGALQVLIQNSDKVVSRVQGDPGRAMAVHRYFTFYLPNAASVAEGWLTMETDTGLPPGRMAQAREVIASLNQAAVKFVSEADAPELDALDVSMKVLKDSLKTDLEKTA